VITIGIRLLIMGAFPGSLDGFLFPLVDMLFPFRPLIHWCGPVLVIKAVEISHLLVSCMYTFLAGYPAVQAGRTIGLKLKIINMRFKQV
jgi:hypothetical protein